MAERQLHVYVDESGDNQLDSSTSGTSHLFYLVAVVVDDVQQSFAEGQLDVVNRQHFGGGEIKSRSIGGDNARRLRVVEAIKEIDFGYYALVVNKDNVIRDSGYQWKKTFYKATRRRMYAKLVSSSWDNLFIHSHQIGSQEYMDSFAAYLSDMTMPSLFYPAVSHSFVSGTESRLVQLADLIAGTLSYCFDAAKRSEFTTEFRSILAEKEWALDVWPITLDSGVILPDVSDELDKTIYSSLLGKVARHLTELSGSSSDDDKMREAVLSKLLCARLYDDSKDQAIYSDKLMAMLVNAGYEKITKQVFTANIIGKIRDAGIIIAGTNMGYRLALSIADIRDYLAHNKSVIYPMFARIKKAQETIITATSNECDILKDDQLLESIVETFCNGQIDISTEQYLGEDSESA